jgi:hypothetical protein
MISSVIGGSSNQVGCRNPTDRPRSRSLATALWEARFAPSFATPSYTTTWDVSFATNFPILHFLDGVRSIHAASESKLERKFRRFRSSILQVDGIR